MVRFAEREVVVVIGVVAVLLLFKSVTQKKYVSENRATDIGAQEEGKANKGANEKEGRKERRKIEYSDRLNIH